MILLRATRTASILEVHPRPVSAHSLRPASAQPIPWPIRSACEHPPDPPTVCRSVAAAAPPLPLYRAVLCHGPCARHASGELPMAYAWHTHGMHVVVGMLSHIWRASRRRGAPPPRSPRTRTRTTWRGCARRRRHAYPPRRHAYPPRRHAYPPRPFPSGSVMRSSWTSVPCCPFFTGGGLNLAYHTPIPISTTPPNSPVSTKAATCASVR